MKTKSFCVDFGIDLRRFVVTVVTRSPPLYTTIERYEMACSDWTLSWVGSVVLRGYEGDETNRFLPSKLKSASIREKAIASWEEERSTKEKPCLWKVFLGLIKFELIVGVIFGLLQGLLATVARPLLLKFCVDGLIDGESGYVYLY